MLEPWALLILLRLARASGDAWTSWLLRWGSSGDAGPRGGTAHTATLGEGFGRHMDLVAATLGVLGRRWTSWGYCSHCYTGRRPRETHGPRGATLGTLRRCWYWPRGGGGGGRLAFCSAGVVTSRCTPRTSHCVVRLLK